tara:strand:- start:10689 stop:12242 length:1554 start_codon:yes stop_codon:yes gene_type:complete
MKLLLKLTIVSLFSIIYGQIWIEASPDILNYGEHNELKSINNKNIIRPYIVKNSFNMMLASRFEFYFNNNFPNQENMGNKYFGKGLGSYQSYIFAINKKYLFMTAEPFTLNVSKLSLEDIHVYPNYYTTQNQVFRPSERPGGFKWLNDRPLYPVSEQKNSGIREFQLYLKYKSLLTGIANVNRWWGPGIHSSLSMSNNTAGFPHYFIGISDSKFFIKSLRLNFNYMVGEVGEHIRPYYFTGIASTLTHQSDESDISVGVTRTYISGGIELSGDRQWTLKDAAILPAEGLLLTSKRDLWYTEGKGTDKWDQVMTFIVQGYFKPSKLKVFFEIGFNDHLHNLYELRAHWDVSAAYLYGLRKKGLFGYKNLIFGVEYLDLIQRTFSDHRGTTASWFDESMYKSNSYKGRRWSAHSGMDSDDFYLYLGYQGKNWTIIPAFNYERHGVVYHFPPEVKIELRLSVIYQTNDWLFDLYLENEYFENIGFVNSNDNVWLDNPLPNSIRRTSTLIFKIQKNLFFSI